MNPPRDMTQFSDEDLAKMIRVSSDTQLQAAVRTVLLYRREILRLKGK